MKAKKVEWTVEVTKNGQESLKSKRTRELSRKFKNSMKARGYKARIIRSEYQLVNVGIIR
jgi:hypothetical protein